MAVFQQGHALIVGVGADLPSTVTDAVGIADILKDRERCAYPPAQVKLLTGEKATRAQVLAGLEQLAATSNAQATVVVYFSGHGYRVTTTTGPAYYLMPYGYDLKRLYETAISGAEFTARLRAIPAQKLLVLLDCCHAGGVGEAKAPEEVTWAKAPLPEEALALLQEGRGNVLIASSREDEYSYAGKPYTAFTLALVEALCGRGVAKKDGLVRVADLAMHAREMVPGRTKDRQHPILHFEQADNFAVAYYAAGDAQPKGLPFTEEPEIEPEPGAWRSVTTTTVHGDQIITTGPVATHGSAVSTGSGVAIAGDRNVVTTGRVGGDVMVDSQKQVGAGSIQDFQALLAEIREQLAGLQGMPAVEQADATAALDQAGELAERDEPPVRRIVRALENVKEILEAAGSTAATALALVPLVNQAIQLAQSLFR